MLGTEVEFPVPMEVAFDYLADPRNRPEWQPSLKAVELLDDGEPRVGLRWVDVTRTGLRPLMEITTLERPDVWAERGRWRGLEAVVSLWFTATEGGCSVALVERVHGHGPWRPVGIPATVAGAFVGKADLKRAARIVSDR